MFVIPKKLMITQLANFWFVPTRHTMPASFPTWCFQNDWLTSAIRQASANASVIVCECEGSLAGTVTNYPAGVSQSQACIDNAADLRYLAVDIDYEGEGMSQALLDEAERRARTWKVSAICLHARQGAELVARLYQSRGYVRDDRGGIDRRPVVYLEAYVLYL